MCGGLNQQRCACSPNLQLCCQQPRMSRISVFALFVSFTDSQEAQKGAHWCPTTSHEVTCWQTVQPVHSTLQSVICMQQQLSCTEIMQQLKQSTLKRTFKRNIQLIRFITEEKLKVKLQFLSFAPKSHFQYISDITDFKVFSLTRRSSSFDYKAFLLRNSYRFPL